MKWFIIGLFIGITSLIPGISGGTILYLSGEYNNFTIYLKNIRKHYFLFMKLILGAVIGLLSFAKILELAFSYYPLITKLFLAYLVLFSLPSFLKKTNLKVNPFLFFLGIIVIFFLNYLVPAIPFVVSDIKITFPFLIFFTLAGFLDGFITIIPGISGSMIMMILGPYYLYKSLCANFFQHPLYLIALLGYFMGDFSGIYWGAKFTDKIVNKHPQSSNSLIFGFITGSLLVIIPFQEVITIPGFIALVSAYILITLTTLNA